MPIEFKQTAMPQGSTDNELYKLEMKYDGSGRRISKTVWRKAVGAENWQKKQVTHYTGIGTEIRENYHNESLEKAKVVVNMPEGLGRYGIEDAKGPDNGSGAGYIPNVKFEWYLKNHLGSTMLVYGTEGNATSAPFTLGTPLAAYDYRAFGEQLTLLPAGDKFTENFTGKERDDEIALNYFGARYLDPMLGMWISVDPKRQFASPYLYAGNGYNPIQFSDKSGNYMIRKRAGSYEIKPMSRGEAILGWICKDVSGGVLAAGVVIATDGAALPLAASLYGPAKGFISSGVTGTSIASGENLAGDLMKKTDLGDVIDGAGDLAKKGSIRASGMTGFLFSLFDVVSGYSDAMKNVDSKAFIDKFNTIFDGDEKPPYNSFPTREAADDYAKGIQNSIENEMLEE